MKKIILAVVVFMLLASPVFAEDLTSTNFKINGATLNSGGQPTTSGTGNLMLINTIGDFSGDPRVYSTSYRSSVGEVEIFTAHVPKIACFETTTDGSSACTTGPAYLNSGGMTRVCGPSGCYDRARFEIDAQNNPTDTLYAVQISEDNFVSDTRIIDGVTYAPKVYSSRTISDYQTKTVWETNAINITGLKVNTQYWIRAVALHGDFTESDPGPVATATTAIPTVSFDIDIAPTSGGATETNPPYNITFSNGSKLIPTGPTQTADDLIWIDTQTNGQGGVCVLVKGTNGGLHSATTGYTIPSVNGDLDGLSEGFGIQKYSTSQLYYLGSGNGSLALLTTISPYGNVGNSVGIVNTVFSKVFDSTGPIYAGRLSLFLKARASTSATPATDYNESIIIVVVPRY